MTSQNVKQRISSFLLTVFIQKSSPMPYVEFDDNKKNAFLHDNSIDFIVINTLQVN
jgi:hypothetical protein